MQIEPEVLTDHTELICSTNIERIVTGRDIEQLHHSKLEVFERGIINVFRGLSWDYKTNSPCSFGKKIIINNLVTHNRWGYSLNWGWQRDQLADL